MMMASPNTRTVSTVRWPLLVAALAVAAIVVSVWDVLFALVTDYGDGPYQARLALGQLPVSVLVSMLLSVIGWLAVRKWSSRALTLGALASIALQVLYEAYAIIMPPWTAETPDVVVWFAHVANYFILPVAYILLLACVAAWVHRALESRMEEA